MKHRPSIHGISISTTLIGVIHILRKRMHVGEEEGLENGNSHLLSKLKICYVDEKPKKVLTFYMNGP